MKEKNSRCLVLNADYTPLSIISWQKAMTWSIRFNEDSKYSIEIIDFYKNDYINGVDKKYPIPAVAKTQRFFRINNQTVAFSRQNIFIRDNYCCQYCHQTLNHNELTYDHVIPKSKWKDRNHPATCWTNIVTACINCNRKKGNKTPKEANMPLRILPIKPNKNIKYLPIASHLSRIRVSIPDEWKIYLPESYL